MDCATADALAALLGERPPLHAEMLEPPPRLRDPHPARTTARTFYGSPYDDHYETEHFTLNWWTDDVTQDMVLRAADALETAWATLVDEQGWLPPVSSDRFYLWVLLDPGLGGTTGYTTEYFTDLYPDGYPLLWLNPTWGDDEAFWAALAAHEFAHMLQYAVRDYSGGGGTEEGWYWEASATWSSELADPDVDGHQYTAAWYATQPELRYDSYAGSHQYGIFVLNAWLDEVLGPGTMADAWTLSAERPGVAWDAILEESTGRPAGELWAGFTGAFGNDRLAESAQYLGVQREGAAIDGAGGTLPYLGTHYWYAPETVRVEAKGEVLLGDQDELGTVVVVEAGYLLAVTGLADDVSYTLLASPPQEDTGEADSGGGEESGGETGDSDPGNGGGAGDDGTGAEVACGCASSPGLPGAALAAVLLVATRAPRGRARPAG